MRGARFPATSAPVRWGVPRDGASAMVFSRSVRAKSRRHRRRGASEAYERTRWMSLKTVPNASARCERRRLLRARRGRRRAFDRRRLFRRRSSTSATARPARAEDFTRAVPPPRTLPPMRCRRSRVERLRLRRHRVARGRQNSPVAGEAGGGAKSLEPSASARSILRCIIRCVKLPRSALTAKTGLPRLRINSLEPRASTDGWMTACDSPPWSSILGSISRDEKRGVP